jgi:hypothetical protein
MMRNPKSRDAADRDVGELQKMQYGSDRHTTSTSSSGRLCAPKLGQVLFMHIHLVVSILTLALLQACATTNTAVPAAAEPRGGDAEPVDPAEYREQKMPPDIRALALARSSDLSVSAEQRILDNIVWQGFGPSPTVSAQVRVPPDNEVTGAIHRLAVHPTNANIIYVGTVNGGIWRTNNALAARPNWTPLTDALPSQSIGGLAFDPTDSTSATLIAGTGRWSNFAQRGDDEIGVYRTTDGGANWAVLGSTTLLGQKITGVIARGAKLFAASFNGGLFRSDDTGATWRLASGVDGILSAGGISAIAEDPASSNRFALAVRNGKVFRSDDLGASYVDISTGIAGLTTTSLVRLSFGPGSVLYAATINAGALAGVSRSSDLGANWVALDVPAVHPGTQGSVNTALVAHPSNANLVFVSGDRITVGPFTGNVFRIDASAALGAQASSVVDAGANNTAPHADSRAMAFDSEGNLLETDDGGIYKLNNPTTATATWTSVIGNLSVSEIHDIALDTLNNLLFSGTQDNGTHVQATSTDLRWRLANGGDGGDVLVDNRSLGSTGSFRYLSSQNFGGFRRQQVNPANSVTASVTFPTISDVQFVTPVELNATTGTRLLIGGANNLYESTNADTATPTYTTIPPAPPLLSGANRGAVAYGSADNPEVIYVGKGSAVLKRQVAGIALIATAALPTGAAAVSDVSIHPQFSQRVAAIDDNQVFFSDNGGTSWTDITFNLGTISANDFRTVEYITGDFEDSLALGTRSGVYLLKLNETSWSRLGTGMPDVLVFDMRYIRSLRTLVAGTLGRGAWKFVFPDPTLFRNGFE